MVCFHTQYSVSRLGIVHPWTDDMAFLELVFPVIIVGVLDLGRCNIQLVFRPPKQGFLHENGGAIA